MSLLLKCQYLFSFAEESIDLKNISINHSGMRNQSLDIVRKQRKENISMRPIEIEIYPDSKPVLADGRHRLLIAKELGDDFISAILRFYDSEGNVLKQKVTKIDLK